jgi:RHS repeat-associated protein
MLSQAIATVGGSSVDVWSSTDAGRTTTDYYRTSGSPDPQLAALDGLMLQSQDPYGNGRLYDCAFYGLEDPAPRLRRIFVNGSPAAWGAGSPPDALVELDWIVGGDDSGRLSRMDVFRFNGEQKVLVQRVQYTYFDPATHDLDVGTLGDLVQVVVSERLDPVVSAGGGTPFGTESWRRRVTQYRYHRSDGQGSPNVEDRYQWAGREHQLKFVIEPEQFEQLAQRLVGEGTVPVGAEPPYDVDQMAPLVLNMEDDRLVWIGDLDDDDVQDDGEKLPLVDFATMVAERYESSGAGRILTLYATGDGGCGSCGTPGASGGTQGSQLSFTYHDRDGDPSVAETVKVEQRLRMATGAGFESDPYRKIWLEHHRPAGAGGVPYLRSSAVEVPSPASRYWVSLFDHHAATRTLRAEYTPAAIVDYSPGNDAEPPDYEIGSTGLVRVFGYTADNRLARRELSDGPPTFTGGACTDCLLVEQTVYGTGAGSTRKHLPSEQRRYRKDRNAPGFDANVDVETTRFTYGFHGGGGDDVAWVKAEVEAERVAENGPGTPAWYASYEFHDARGDNVWSVAADGAITAREFESANAGQLEKVIRNAPNTMPGTVEGLVTTGFGRNGDGGALETRSVRDLLGRVRESVQPGGVSSYTLRNSFTHPDRPGIRYYCEVALPPVVDASAGAYGGPATATWFTAGGQAFATSGYRPGSGGYLFAPPPLAQVGWPVLVTGYALAEELSRRIVRHDIAAQVKAVLEWNALTGPVGDPDALDGPNNGVHVTLFGQDRLGRPLWTINANGTAERMSYDVLDRVVATEVGLANTSDWTPDASTMAVATRHFYDSGGTATQGVGNGNLTRIEQVVSGSGVSEVVRPTLLKYDWRDRRISVVNPLPPHDWTEYDNLDRPVAHALFTAEPTAINAPLDSGGHYRGRYTETSYSQRGLVYRQAVATNPKSSTPSFIETHTWFDQVGRAVGTWGPNGPAQKSTYDGLGRPKAVYLTDRRNDPLPGAANNFAAVFNLSTHAANVSDDVVLEQANTRFIAGRGLADFVTRRQRTHDAGTSDVGALDSVGYPSNKSIATYSGAWYDAANRAIREAQFGTNTSGFQSGGTAPTIDQSAPPSATAADASKLVNETRYDARGLVESLTDPMGRITRFHHDALGRRIMVVENFDPANPVVFGWTSGPAGGPGQLPLMRWDITAGLDVEHPDRNRATSFVFDGLGNLVRQVAHLLERVVISEDPPAWSDEPRVQETAYFYGIDGSTPSSIASNDLLAEIRYPDSDASGVGGGGGAVTKPQPVRFAYNRQGEVVEMWDANVTRHQYTRDALGRVTLDKATVSTSVTGFQIDDTVDAIGSEFDTLGRLKSSRSCRDHGAGSQSVANAVQFGYDDLWQVAAVTQQPDGDISAGSKAVAVAHDIRPVAGGNFSRRSSLTYPDGWALETFYGSAGSIDDRISRARDLRDAATDAVYAQYDWIGTSMPAVVKYGIPEVTLSRFIAPNGTSATGTYPGLDRYGRVARQQWSTTGFGPHTGDPANPAVPNKPPLVETAYTYDNASSRTGAFDARPGSAQPLSQSYSYDGLHRLAEALRGVWNHDLGSPSVTQGRNSQEWSLDPLGNWLEVATDLDGAGGFESAETETRDFRDPALAPPTNRVNELYERTLAPDAGGDELDLTYDFAGNLLRQELTDNGTITTALRYTHDAWNRLVKVQFEDTSAALHPHGEYEYNGLNWRTVRRADTRPADSTHAIDQKRLMYYGPEWQLLEERIDEAFQSSPGIDRHAQHVWGVRYIDDIVATRQNHDPLGAGGPQLVAFHLTDAQFSTVALVSQVGALLERVAYTAYGVARQQPSADVTGEGAVDGADLGVLLTAFDAEIGDPEYRSEADLNLDGVIDGADYGLVLSGFTATPLPDGVISSPLVDNHVGYDAYLFAPETRSYLVRHRWYLPPLGRWGQRDPLDYVDGLSLYEYVNSDPIARRDYSGLQSFLQHPIGALEAMIAQWEAAGLVTHQIVARLAKLGVSAAVISQLTGSSVQTAQQAIDLVKLESEFGAALAGGLSDAIASTLGQMTCEAAQQLKNQWCGSQRGGNQPKSCKNMPMPVPRVNGTRDCTDFLTRAHHFRMCGVARAAVLLLCPRDTDPNRFGHLTAFFNMLTGEATCRAKWRECHELNNKCWEALHE